MLKKADSPGASVAKRPLAKSRWIAIALAVLLAGSWIFFAMHFVEARKTAAGSNDNSGRVFKCAPGPWGNLECTRITVELPDHFITEDALDVGPTRWYFKGHTRKQALDLFRSAKLTASQLEWLEKSHWNPVAEGLWITPVPQLVLSLSPESRAIIYNVLAEFPENTHYQTAFAFRPEFIEDRLKYSGLSETTISLFRKLLYPRGQVLMFADSETVMQKIPDRQEKLRFIKMLSRRNSLLVKLRITPESDVEELLDYWGQGGRAKDLRPLLESLAKVPGGCSIDIAHLLPPMVRQRVYTYPFPTSAEAEIENCHWTALNFFNEQPDPKYLKPAVVEKAIEEEFEHVTGERRMGDVLLLVNSASALVHSAVYIADDIVFTKNGVSPSHPWVYMKFEDMLLFYETPDEPLETWVYRRKSL